MQNCRSGQLEIKVFQRSVSSGFGYLSIRIMKKEHLFKLNAECGINSKKYVPGKRVKVERRKSSILINVRNQILALPTSGSSFTVSLFQFIKNLICFIIEH